MQHEHRFLEPYRVNGPVGATHVILDHFQYASATKTLKHLRSRMQLAVLREMQRKPERLPDICRELQQVLVAAADPLKWSFCLVHITLIPV